jgi:hypothetical protein
VENFPVESLPVKSFPVKFKTLSTGDQNRKLSTDKVTSESLKYAIGSNKYE